jgi:hypothetical protein
MTFGSGSVRRIPAAIYLTTEELAQRVQEREAEAAAMPDGPAKQAFLMQTGSLRTYLDMKLWIESPGLRSGN